MRRTDHYLTGGDLAALPTPEFPDARQRDMLAAGEVQVSGTDDVLEVIAPDQINEAYARLEKSDVRYRFVIDISQLGQAA